jgi:hypothetical protein
VLPVITLVSGQGYTVPSLQHTKFYALWPVIHLDRRQYLMVPPIANR